MTDLSKLSDADLLALARKFVSAEKPEANPLALSSPQLHALSGSVLEGIPVAGPYLRAGAERAGAALDQYTDGAPGYADALKRRQGAFQQSVEQNPVTAAVGNVIGGVAGTAPLVAAAPVAFGAGGGGLLARTAASTVSGGILGGADAAARSGGDPMKTGIGAGVGAGVGVLGPGAAQVLGRGVAGGVDRAFKLSSPTGPASGLSRRAAQYAMDTFVPSRQAAMDARIRELGPQAMLADVSPEWMGVARGAASRPGSRDAIVGALLARNDTKNARLGSDLDASLGRTAIPSRVESHLSGNRAYVAQEYEPLLQNARAVNTQQLANNLEAAAVNLRGPAQQAVQRVRQMLDVPGAPGNLDPHPRALLSTRRAIDGMMASEVNPQVIGELTQARNAVDAELARAVPGIKAVDAQIEELARQSGGLQRGSQALDSGKTAIRPQELTAEMAAAAQPQGQTLGPSATPYRIQQGARAEIDRVVGLNANDPLAMQRMVKSEGDWNRDKLRTLFGQDRADRALGAVDREVQFAQTGNRVTSGSDTAMAQRFGNFLDDASTPSRVPTDLSVLGTLGRGAQKVTQALLGSNAEAKASRFADELGRVSVAQGPERDALIRSLLDAARRRQSLEPLSEGTRELLAALFRASPPAANQQLK